MAPAYDVRELSEQFARFRLPARLLVGGLSVVFGGLAALICLANPTKVLALETDVTATPVIAFVCTVFITGLSAYACLWGFRQVAVTVTCDAEGVTFTSSRGRTRVIPWTRAVPRFSLHDWRDSASRRAVPPTFALAAHWGPWILAILTAESFDGILMSAKSAGLEAVKGGVNRLLTGDPLLTVVYRFNRRR